MTMADSAVIALSSIIFADGLTTQSLHTVSSPAESRPMNYLNYKEKSKKLLERIGYPLSPSQRWLMPKFLGCFSGAIDQMGMDKVRFKFF